MVGMNDSVLLCSYFDFAFLNLFSQMCHVIPKNQLRTEPMVADKNWTSIVDRFGGFQIVKLYKNWTRKPFHP